MNKILIAIVVVALLVGGYFVFVKRSASENVSTNDSSASGKLDMNVVCESALAYMSFPDGEAAAKFVAECKAGGYPEVVERYKADMGLGDGATI